jgi:hypothetical protein
MDIELEPPQPDEVRRAVEELLDLDPAPVDPWWEAGLEEALRDRLDEQAVSPPVGSG